ncbi:hypothetical protein FOCC_FOCC011156 [Frankliniella occidentalis]|nr:hypothetical protein FOCC_FOCC011156 [Frankliniella occidentalis]
MRRKTLHAWSTQVHRVQSLAGNVAVLRCNIPAQARSLVRVTGWLRDGAAIHLGTNGRYTATSQGTLHIRDVGEMDVGVSYHCQTQHVISGAVRKVCELNFDGILRVFKACISERAHQRRLLARGRLEKSQGNDDSCGVAISRRARETHRK